MATPLGLHSERLHNLRALRSHKGRRQQQRFTFEGPTLLAEAAGAGFPIDEIYATQAAYDSVALVRELESGGSRVFVIPGAAAERVSDVDSPSGVLAVGPVRLQDAATLFRLGSPLLILAGLNDPANAGTLLRSADAFGCRGVLFGESGVEPYHPKVVRGSMGAIFRLPLAVAGPSEAAAAAAAAGVRMAGLAAGGAPISADAFRPPLAIVVGHERRGLGPWEGLCANVFSIPMTGRAESLSAAVAGSIALYEASVSTT